MAINAKRLLKLADFLETVPRKAFDMSDWQLRKADKPEGERPGECGFAGCAIGWAAHGKLFRGLSIHYGYPIYNNVADFDAVASLFSITDLATKELFGAHRPGTPKQVSKRIREFVREHTS